MTLRGPDRATALRWATPWATAAAYLAVGCPSMMWLHAVRTAGQGHVVASAPMPWIATGVGLAAVLRLGPSAVLGVLLGAFTLWGLIEGAFFPLALAEALGEAVCILLVVRLLGVLGYRAGLDRYRDALGLIVALAVGALAAAAIDALGVLLTVWYAPEALLRAVPRAEGVVRVGRTLVVDAGLFASSVRWALDLAAGCALVIPVAADRPWRRDRAAGATRWLHASGVAAAIALWIPLAYTLTVPTERPMLVAGALLLVVWCAARVGVRAAALATLLLSLAVAVGFSVRAGAFAGIDDAERASSAWGFIWLMVGYTLFLTPLVLRRAAVRQAMAGTAERYRQLFLGSPFPLWVEDAVNGRILLANPAALRTYGYDESGFVGLPSADLVLEVTATLPSSEADRAVTHERHRTGAASTIEVTVTRVGVVLDGRPVMVSFVEPLTERNQLRRTVLIAEDLERFRLGRTLHDQLLPLLRRIAALAASLSGAPGAAVGGTLNELTAAVAGATDICRRLTRGVSPLQEAGGDLPEALRRLPSALGEDGLRVQCVIEAPSDPGWPVERRDHVYRLAEEAVRGALARGAQAVRIHFHSVDGAVSLRIEQVGGDVVGHDRDGLTEQSITARALAAGDGASVSLGGLGGREVTFECRPDSAPAAPADVPAVAIAAPTPPAAAAPSGSSLADQYRPLAAAVALVVTLVVAEIVAIAFLTSADSVLRHFGTAVSLPWLASGVGLAGLLLGGRRLWPAIVVGNVIVWRLYAHYTWGFAVADALAEAGSALLVSYLLERLHFDARCRRLRDLVLLVGSAAVAQAIAAGAYMGLLVWAEPSPAGELGALPSVSAALAQLAAPASTAHGLRWWLSGVAGIVLVVPATLPWSWDALSRIRRQPLVTLTWLVALGGVILAVWRIDDAGARLLVLGGAVAVVTWASLAFGVALASTATLLLTLAATASFGLGSGVLAPRAGEQGGYMLWSFIVLLWATGQLLNMLLAENESDEQRLGDRERRYRTLFDAVPEPLFAIGRSDGRILAANARARRRYGYSAEEFAQRTFAQLAVGEGRLRADAKDGPRAVRSERHRTRGGELFEVEVIPLPAESSTDANLLYAIDVTERNRLRTRMLETTDRERRRLAREFHDGLGQVLTGLVLGLGPVSRSVARGATVDPADAAFVADVAHQAVETCERVLQGVSPLQDVAGDLAEALRRLPLRLPVEHRARLDVVIDAAAAVSASLEEREHLYQIAQEAVTNALKHAQATHIRVRLGVSARRLEVSVEDDGVGIGDGRQERGIGLESLRLRAQALNGRLVVRRRPGRPGTQVSCVCPQPPAKVRAAGQ